MDILNAMKPCPLYHPPNNRFTIPKSPKQKMKELRSKKMAEKKWVIHKHPPLEHPQLVFDDYERRYPRAHRIDRIAMGWELARTWELEKRI